MKIILVPTDFSVHALYALKTAARIAKKTLAQVKIVHAYNFPISEVHEEINFKGFNEQMSAINEEKLEALSKMSFLEGISVSMHFENEMKPWEIVTDDKYKNADLIVIGSHGESGYHKQFIGSNTEKIIRMAEAPVLTVKKSDDIFEIKNIVFASNFHNETYSVFEKIKFFTDLYKTHIDLLKVITPHNFESTIKSKKLMDNFANKFKLFNYTINIFNASNIEKGILDFSSHQKTDLIAIETHGKLGINHLIGGSLAEKIADDAILPVLTIKIKKDKKSSNKNHHKLTDYKNWGSE